MRAEPSHPRSPGWPVTQATPAAPIAAAVHVGRRGERRPWAGGAGARDGVPRGGGAGAAGGGGEAPAGGAAAAAGAVHPDGPVRGGTAWVHSDSMTSVPDA